MKDFIENPKSIKAENFKEIFKIINNHPDRFYPDEIKELVTILQKRLATEVIDDNLLQALSILTKKGFIEEKDLLIAVAGSESTNLFLRYNCFVKLIKIDNKTNYCSLAKKLLREIDPSAKSYTRYNGVAQLKDYIDAFEDLEYKKSVSFKLDRLIKSMVEEKKSAPVEKSNTKSTETKSNELINQ